MFYDYVFPKPCNTLVRDLNYRVLILLWYLQNKLYCCFLSFSVVLITRWLLLTLFSFASGSCRMEKNLRGWTNQAVTLIQMKIPCSMRLAWRSAIIHSERELIFHWHKEGSFFPTDRLFGTVLGLDVKHGWGQYWSCIYGELYSFVPVSQCLGKWKSGNGNLPL